MKDLFTKKNFTSHSGLELTWKIETEALTRRDWACLAHLVAQCLHFSEVVGVPDGGLPLAEMLRYHAEPDRKTRLIVDDVLTTGDSMRKFLAENPSPDGWTTVGVVAFDRSRGVGRPTWVIPIFEMSPLFGGVR